MTMDTGANPVKYPIDSQLYYGSSSPRMGAGSSGVHIALSQDQISVKSSYNRGVTNHFGSHTEIDRDALREAHRELMRTHQEILALEEEIRKSRLL